MQMDRKNVISTSLLVLVAAVIVFLFFRNKENSTIQKMDLEKPFISVVRNTKKIRGAIVAAHIVDIKPQLSGLLDKIYVTVGERVQKNHPIAKIRVVPSLDEIASAQKEFKINRIQYELDKKMLDDHSGVYDLGGISKTKLKEIEANMKISKLNYESSMKKLEMLLNSTVRGADNEDFTIVHSTLRGVVLEIPFQQGARVVKSTSNTNGSSIASIANMDSLVFKSKINESDIAKIHVGMKLPLLISSMDSIKVAAVISEISPQSINENGVNKFRFLARLNARDCSLAYSGITATADIVFAETDSVLCIKEKYLQFDNGKPYVEVWCDEERVIKKVETGLSDGFNIEIKNGLTLHENLLLPDWRKSKTP